jgi:hypothetical protein
VLGLRWQQPSAFPRVGVLPSRVALLGAEQCWIGAFYRRVMELNFVLDQDINQADRLAPILTELGLSAGEILEQAQAEPTKKLLREQTGEARSRGIFGAPTNGSGALRNALRRADKGPMSGWNCTYRTMRSIGREGTGRRQGWGQDHPSPVR